MLQFTSHRFIKPGRYELASKNGPAVSEARRYGDESLLPEFP